MAWGIALGAQWARTDGCRGRSWGLVAVLVGCLALTACSSSSGNPTGPPVGGFSPADLSGEWVFSSYEDTGPVTLAHVGDRVTGAACLAAGYERVRAGFDLVFADLTIVAGSTITWTLHALGDAACEGAPTSGPDVSAVIEGGVNERGTVIWGSEMDDDFVVSFVLLRV